jgi:tetratricopeptide (TPR) repeat protein
VVFKEPGASVPQEALDRAMGIYMTEMPDAPGGGAFEAEWLLAPLVARADRDVEGRYALGNAYARRGRIDLALGMWNQVLQLNPRHEDALEAIAFACHRTGEFDQARQYYERLIEVNPTSSLYYGRYANVLNQLGEPKLAIEATLKALEINPTLTQARSWLVDLSRSTGDAKTAKEQSRLLHQFKSLGE